MAKTTYWTVIVKVIEIIFLKYNRNRKKKYSLFLTYRLFEEEIRKLLA